MGGTEQASTNKIPKERRANATAKREETQATRKNEKECRDKKKTR